MPSSLAISRLATIAPDLRVGGSAPARRQGTASARAASHHHQPPAAPPHRAESDRAAAAAPAPPIAGTDRRLPPLLRLPPRPRRGCRRRAYTRTRTRAPARAPARGFETAARRRARSRRNEPNGDEQLELGAEHVGRKAGPRKWPPQRWAPPGGDQLGDIHLGDRRRAQRLAPPHRVRTSRRARLASTRRRRLLRKSLAALPRCDRSSTADLRSRSGGRSTTTTCATVAAVEPMRDLLVVLVGLHICGTSPWGLSVRRVRRGVSRNLRRLALWVADERTLRARCKPHSPTYCASSHGRRSRYLVHPMSASSAFDRSRKWLRPKGSAILQKALTANATPAPPRRSTGCSTG